MNPLALTGAAEAIPTELPIEVALDIIETAGDALLADVLTQMAQRIQCLEDRIRFLEQRSERIPRGGRVSPRLTPKMENTTMETNRTNTDCWPLDEELGLFEDRMMPLFLLVSLSLKAEGSVVPAALPMRRELAGSLLSVQREWNLLRERLAGR